MKQTGIHRVSMRLADGSSREYHYPSRGAGVSFWNSDMGIAVDSDEYEERFNIAVANTRIMGSFADAKRREIDQGSRPQRSRIKEIVRASKRRARQKGISHTITADDGVAIATRQGNKCAISGLPLSWSKGDSNTFRNPYSASLDRIDSFGGYDIGNVRLVLTIVNFGMSNWGEDTYREVCKAVASAPGGNAE